MKLSSTFKEGKHRGKGDYQFLDGSQDEKIHWKKRKKRSGEKEKKPLFNGETLITGGKRRVLSGGFAMSAGQILSLKRGGKRALSKRR